MFTAKSVIYPCSPNPDEILISGEDENGRPSNAPIITDATLGKQLAETPANLVNPAFTAAQALFAADKEALAEAQKAFDDAQKALGDTPPTVPNPAYPPLELAVFAKADEALAAHAEALK